MSDSRAWSSRKVAAAVTVSRRQLRARLAKETSRHGARRAVATISRSLTHLLVLLGDKLSKAHVVPESGEPELGNTLDLLGRLGLGLIDLGDASLVILLVVRVGSLAGGDLLGRGLSGTGDDGGTALVEGRVLGGELERGGKRTKQVLCQRGKDSGRARGCKRHGERSRQRAH